MQPRRLEVQDRPEMLRLQSLILPQRETLLARNSKIDTAEAQFKKAQREQDGKQATAEYEAMGIATRAKTAKLKALRLARDAELAVAADAKPNLKRRKAKPKAPTISDFQRDRQGSRNR
jgi:hypothetical protein